MNATLLFLQMYVYGLRCVDGNCPNDKPCIVTVYANNKRLDVIYTDKSGTFAEGNPALSDAKGHWKFCSHSADFSLRIEPIK